MATIVRHKPSGQRYLLVGTGYAQSASARPGFWGGDLFPTKEQSEESVMYLCDTDGRIRLAKPTDVEVVEIDGRSPGDWLD